MNIENLTPLEKLLIIRYMIERGELAYGLNSDVCVDYHSAIESDGKILLQ